MKNLDPVNIREELQDMLSRDEYQDYYLENQNILLNLIKRLEEWLNELLMAIFPESNLVDKAAEWITYLIIGIGISLLVLFIYLLWSRLVGVTRFNPKQVGTVAEFAQTPQRHLLEADKLAEQGELRSALRHAFLAYILYLNENNWIEVRVWKTNWEYYEELKENNLEIVTSFYDIAVKFDEAMYGGKTINTEEFIAYRDRINSLIQDNSPMKSTNHR